MFETVGILHTWLALPLFTSLAGGLNSTIMQSISGIPLSDKSLFPPSQQVDPLFNSVESVSLTCEARRALARGVALISLIDACQSLAGSEHRLYHNIHRKQRAGRLILCWGFWLTGSHIKRSCHALVYYYTGCWWHCCIGERRRVSAMSASCK